MTLERPRSNEQACLSFLVFLYIVACCLSLARIATPLPPIVVDTAKFHLFFDMARFPQAVVATGTFSVVALLFVVSRFSIGFFVGFYLYAVVLGYLWLVSFTDLQYDHRLAEISVAVSAIAFLVPALFGGGSAGRAFRLSETAFDRLLIGIVGFSVIAIALGAAYNFRLVSIGNIYAFRDDVQMPRLLLYAIGMISYALLPFTFAAFLIRKKHLGAISALILLLCLYPVTLSKTILFAPFWIVGVLILSKLFTARVAAVLSLLVPVAGTLVLVSIFKHWAGQLYTLVSFRMVAIPSVALDVYAHFFSTHELTHFCQISFVKLLVHCPYEEQLGPVMAREYGLGNFNASLLATEGIASVGFYLTPIVAFLCGLVIAIGNRCSSGLPAAFILVSGAMLPQLLVNVPFSVTLLTNGGALLFLLWRITPRTIFKEKEF